jgi:hypothetical protein
MWPAKEIMSTFGFYPGPIDYWMLVTDWRNGSVAIIMLAIGALIGSCRAFLAQVIDRESKRFVDALFVPK